jgi:hypothetical protein
MNDQATFPVFDEHKMKQAMAISHKMKTRTQLHHKSTLKSLRLWAFWNFKKITIKDSQVPRFFQNPQRTFFHLFLF